MIYYYSLHYSTLSNIASADGLNLHPWSWRGLRISDRTSRSSFPHQEEPTPHQRCLWRKLLRWFICPDKPGQLLFQPLGPWTAPSNSRWGAYVYNNDLYPRQDPHTNMGDRSVAVHFPRSLPLSDGVSKAAYYTNPPDWYSASIPAMAPADITGEQVFTTTCAAICFRDCSSHAFGQMLYFRQCADAQVKNPFD